MSRSTPLFSIITVCYNADKVLERTLQSVASQSYQSVEYILVDGNSTDNTLPLIQSYQGVISRWVSEPDSGIYDAMNKGLTLATGEYLCFLNAGDTFYHADTLAAIASSLEGALLADGTLPQIVYGETAIVDEKGSFLHMRRLKAPQKLSWKSFKSGMLVCHQAFFVNRILAQSEPYNVTYRFSADFDWCIRLMKRAHGLHGTGLTLVNYLNEGTTTQNHKASLKERFRIMCNHYGVLSTLLHHAWFVMRVLFK
ncbi:MAG: glycosyltransferase family 2 protein [Phocaeicola sp.]